MVKVLFLSPLPPPNYGSAMSSLMCLEILRNSRNIEVKNIKLNYSKEFDDIGKFSLSKIKGYFHVRKEVEALIKNLNPDLVYMVPATYNLGLFRDYLFFKKVKKNWKGKVLFHIRSRITEKNWYNPFYRFVYKKMLKGQRAIVLDDSLIKDLHGLISKRDLFVLPNAIKNEVSDFQFNKIEEKRRKRDTFNLLFLSNMDETKGWQKLLEACKILKDESIEFKCNFVGGWPGEKEKHNFEEFVLSNKLSLEVKHLGARIGKQKSKIFQDSDILVYPTTLDTFGRVIIEGMMQGLPVIANGIAAIPTTVQHNKTGFVLKENSPREIATYIKSLRDKKLREKMGLAGRKRFLEKYELQKYEKDFLKIILSSSNN